MSFKIVSMPLNSNNNLKDKKNIIIANNNNELCVVTYTMPTWTLKFVIRYKFLDNFLSKPSANCIRMIRNSKKKSLEELNKRNIQVFESKSGLLINLNNKIKLKSLSFITLQMLKYSDSLPVIEQNNIATATTVVDSSATVTYIETNKNDAVLDQDNTAVDTTNNQNNTKVQYQDIENETFFSLFQPQDLSSLKIEFTDIIPIADTVTFQNFFNYTIKEEGFELIKQEFIDILNQLKENAKKCVQNETIKFEIIKINELIATVKSVDLYDMYGMYGKAIFQIYMYTRYQLNKINQILKFFAKNHQSKVNMLISQNNLENIITNLFTDIDQCLPGVIGRVENCYDDIKVALSGKKGIIKAAKEDILEAFIIEFHNDTVLEGERQYHPGSRVHYIYAYKNILADIIGVSKQEKDEYVTSVHIKPLHIHKLFHQTLLKELLPIKIIDKLSADIYESFKEIVNSRNMSHIFTNKVKFKDYDQYFYADITEKVIDKFNKLYEIPANSEKQLKLTTLIKIDCEDIYEDTNTCVHKDIKDRLHAWVAQAVFVGSNNELTPTLLADIPLNISNDEDLAIARIGTCHFWIIDKKQLQDNNDIKLDFDNYRRLELQHITPSLLKNMEEKTKISLISLALMNTDNAEDIINFFNICDLTNDNNVLETVNKVLSNQIITNNTLRENLVQLIYNDCCRINIESNNNFNLAKNYWYLDSTLLGYVLVKIIDNAQSNGIDISNIIETLTPKQILNLEKTNNLDRILSVCKNKRIKLNLDFFYKSFTSLMQMKHANLISKIVTSGLIDKFLLSYIIGNNRLKYQLLELFIEKNKIDGIKYLFKLKNIHNLQNINIKFKDQSGNTLFHLAAKHGNLELINLLLATTNINRYIKNNEGNTALDMAEQQGHNEIIAILKKTKH